MRERRLLHALRLLTRSGTRPRISAVAYAVGFSDEKTFSRAFRRRFGFLPRDASVGEASPRTRGRDEPVLLSWMKTLTV
ncbi:helix-turn-helix domain-containing protein [Methylobacterium sp. Leaf113]|uniref:helix-turn-helix domain-containing protein n=1 Tax=Methylobacterium sp. Leaf113 TaxID=1736259 RepID=UPI0023791700|nr:helix-turn-helix domain-containing protein [Methylobacterium sp. Leaf113]